MVVGYSCYGLSDKEWRSDVYMNRREIWEMKKITSLATKDDIKQRNSSKPNTLGIGQKRHS